ncbi:MAG: helix-turn-helix transcriptional regulator [Oscillospiraceae bacterium]|nr:helix-turn-helix transcriptional regulator [Oscillospiraceae bacterium]
MSESICRFMPAKNYTDDLQTVHFVYETEHETLRQPFLHPLYYLHLVTGGAAVLRMCGKEYRVGAGDVFFSFPGCPFELAAQGELRYMYISFFGSCAGALLEQMGIGYDSPVYTGMAQVTEFWFSAISRCSGVNANFLTESVLLYTLSFLSGVPAAEHRDDTEKMFRMITEYINGHFREQGMSLQRVADIFSYTEKYLSFLFKKNMQIGFTQYVNNLRIQYALRLIDEGWRSVSEIAYACGYGDALYFSKVFRKKVGCPPSRRIREKQEGKG